MRPIVSPCDWLLINRLLKWKSVWDQLTEYAGLDNPSFQLQSQLDSFFAAQRKWQQDMEGRILLQLEQLRDSSQTKDTALVVDSFPERPVNPGQGVVCFNCEEGDTWLDNAASLVALFPSIDLRLDSRPL